MCAISLMCPPVVDRAVSARNSSVKVPTPVSHNMTAFGDKVFKEVMELK